MKKNLLKILSFAISLRHVSLTMFILFLVSNSFSVIVAQENKQKNSSSDMKAEREILQLENKIFDAIKNKDAKKLESLLAEDFIYRTHEGKESNRAVFLELITSFHLKIVSVKGEHLKVELLGDVAVLTGIQRAKVKMDDGRLVEGLGAFTDVFVRRNNQWFLKYAFNVELPTVDNAQKNDNK